MSQILYQSLIKSLTSRYQRVLTAHVVSVLGQYNSNYGLEHWKAAKRVLQYLQVTKRAKLVFKKMNKPVVGFANVDWGTDIDHRRSYTGYVFQIANSNQLDITQTEVCGNVKYVALSEATKEAVHLRAFLSEIIGKQPATTIYNDNQAAGNMARNSVQHGRAKHIDLISDTTSFVK